MKQVLRRRSIQLRDFQKADMCEGVQHLEFGDCTDTPYGRRWRPCEEEKPNCGETYEDDSQIGKPCYAIIGVQPSRVLRTRRAGHGHDVGVAGLGLLV